jgi:serine acetyltransferase
MSDPAQTSVVMGATVLSRVDVGAWATVGAGALAVHDVPESITVIGNPARPLAAVTYSWTGLSRVIRQ